MVVLEKHDSCFPEVGIFERHGSVMFSVLLVHFQMQEICSILVPILFYFSHNIVQSDMTTCRIVTHILLLVQRFQILEDVVRSFGGAYQKCVGDVMLLFELTTHGYAGICFSTTTGTTENKQGG